MLTASSKPIDGGGPRHLLRGWLVLAALVGMFAADALAFSLGVRLGQGFPNRVSEAHSISEVQTKLHALEVRVALQPDWAAIARAAQPSIFTIATKTGEGSAWAARAGPTGSDLVTNFHVVAGAWDAAEVLVKVHQGDRIVDGTIVRVDRADDLAVIHIADRAPELQVSGIRPRLGETVMAVGSPLGLGGSVSLGVVSGFRSLGGSDYIQFSAPISPGNSGGPVLDGRGRVVAVAAAKFVGEGVEALSLSIPVETVCTTVISCFTNGASPTPSGGG